MQILIGVLVGGFFFIVIVVGTVVLFRKKKIHIKGRRPNATKRSTFFLGSELAFYLILLQNQKLQT